MGFSYSMNINQLAKIKIKSKGICIINTAISEAYTLNDLFNRDLTIIFCGAVDNILD